MPSIMAGQLISTKEISRKYFVSYDTVNKWRYNSPSEFAFPRIVCKEILETGGRATFMFDTQSVDLWVTDFYNKKGK